MSDIETLMIKQFYCHSNDATRRRVGSNDKYARGERNQELETNNYQQRVQINSMKQREQEDGAAGSELA